MRVEDIMTRQVSSCSPGTNAAAAAEIMWNQSCGSLPVVEDGGRIVGIITDRDLFIALGTSNRRASDISVGEFMRTGLALTSSNDSLRTALSNMTQNGLQQLPVVDSNGTLQGSISITDILSRSGDSSSGISNDDMMSALRSLTSRSSRSQSAGA